MANILIPGNLFK